MVKRLEREQDIYEGTITFDLEDGCFLTVDRRAVQKVGLVRVLQMNGVEPPTERQPVFQDGKKIGTVPGQFDPSLIKSTSFFYEPRAGDFKKTEEGWCADRMLCPGDFEAIPGFVWDR